MDVPEPVAADLQVAAVAAACTVALPVVLRFGLGVAVSPTPLLSPIAVYFGYVFLGRGSGVDDPRLWSLATVVVALATAVLVV
ncbi:hypothetical protein [Haloplanus halophilus]|uniref:hypothetical protein n=1 Tax=Haloplanus halophilus TaxID=2949993 RepID=UPI00203CF816|nr:hypothetical protein [Haloplanus sp. GDY1]